MRRPDRSVADTDCDNSLSCLYLGATTSNFIHHFNFAGIYSELFRSSHEHHLTSTPRKYSITGTHLTRAPGGRRSRKYHVPIRRSYVRLRPPKSPHVQALPLRPQRSQPSMLRSLDCLTQAHRRAGKLPRV